MTDAPKSDDEMSDADRLNAIADLAERINTNKLPNPHDKRVRRWRDQAASAATAAEEDSDGE